MADHYYIMAYKGDPSNGDVLQAYAQFLRSMKKDYKKALEVYAQVCIMCIHAISMCAPCSEAVERLCSYMP
jgi:hypothetical protein